jgi:hypothetical protein
VPGGIRPQNRGRDANEGRFLRDIDHSSTTRYQTARTHERQPRAVCVGLGYSVDAPQHIRRRDTPNQTGDDDTQTTRQNAEIGVGHGRARRPLEHARTTAARTRTHASHIYTARDGDEAKPTQQRHDTRSRTAIYANGNQREKARYKSAGNTRLSNAI